MKKRAIYSLEFDLVADSLKEKLDSNKTIYFTDFIDVQVYSYMLDYIVSCKAINKKYLIYQKVYDSWFENFTEERNCLNFRYNTIPLKIKDKKDFCDIVKNIAILYRIIELKAIRVIE